MNTGNGPINRPPPLFYARHFVWLAKAVKVAARELKMTDEGKQKLVNHFVKHLKNTNPNFDEQKFRRATEEVTDEQT